MHFFEMLLPSFSVLPFRCKHPHPGVHVQQRYVRAYFDNLLFSVARPDFFLPPPVGNHRHGIDFLSQSIRLLNRRSVLPAPDKNQSANEESNDSPILEWNLFHNNNLIV
jgi:hypothetical protein